MSEDRILHDFPLKFKIKNRKITTQNWLHIIFTSFGSSLCAMCVCSFSVILFMSRINVFFYVYLYAVIDWKKKTIGRSSSSSKRKTIITQESLECRQFFCAFVVVSFTSVIRWCVCLLQFCVCIALLTCARTSWWERDHRTCHHRRGSHSKMCCMYPSHDTVYVCVGRVWSDFLCEMSNVYRKMGRHLAGTVEVKSKCNLYSFFRDKLVFIFDCSAFRVVFLAMHSYRLRSHDNDWPHQNNII